MTTSLGVINVFTMTKTLALIAMIILAISLSAQPLAFNQAKGTKGKCDCLLQWTQKLSDEYPSLNLAQMPMNRLQAATMNLFADEYFVPVFDKPFEELSSSTRLRVAKALENCLKHKDYQARFTWQRSPIGNPFAMDRGNMAFDQTSSLLARHRKIRTEYHQLVQEIEQLSDGVQGYNRLHTLSRTVQRRFMTLWPSEQVALTELIARRKSELSEVALWEQLGRIEGQADSRGKANELQQFERQQSQYFQEIPGSVRQEILARHQEALNGVLDRLMAGEQRTIDGVSGQIATIAESNQWHDRFQRSYRNSFQQAIIGQTYAYYLQKRESMLSTQFSQIERLFAQQNTFAAIDEVKKTFLHVPLNDAALTQRIAQAAEARKQALKSANLGKPAYAWFEARESAKGISPGELINRIESVAIEKGPYQMEIARSVRALGKRIDSTSQFFIRAETELLPLTYTSTNVSTGQLMKEVELYAYSIKVHLMANGEVYREGLIMSNQITLNSGVIARFLKRRDEDELAQSRANDMQKLVRGLFENNDNYQEPVFSDEAWEQMLLADYEQVQQRYQLYLKAKEISPTNNLFSIKEIGGFEGIHKQSQAIPGLEAYQALKQNQMMQFMDDLFLRGQTFGNDWKALSRWTDGLAAIDIPILTRNNNRGLPFLTQEISGSTLNLGSNSTAHALMSHSYLTEPNCLVPLKGQFYRVTARSLSHIRINYAADELMSEVVDMTRKSIVYFASQLRLHNRTGTSGGTVAYEPRPTSHSFTVRGEERTGIQVEKGDKVEIHASGSVTFGVFAGAGGPDGIGGFTQYNKVAGHRHGALLISIGNGEWMTAGSQKQILVQNSGQLFFAVNDAEPQNNQGQFNVRVNVFKRKK